MSSWQVQDAKARFSELLDTALKQGPQVVTRRGVEAAVSSPSSNGDAFSRPHSQASRLCSLAQGRTLGTWCQRAGASSAAPWWSLK